MRGELYASLGSYSTILRSPDLSQRIGSPGVRAKDGWVRMLARAIGSADGAEAVSWRRSRREAHIGPWMPPICAISNRRRQPTLRNQG